MRLRMTRRTRRLFPHSSPKKALCSNSLDKEEAIRDAVRERYVIRSY